MMLLANNATNACYNNNTNTNANNNNNNDASSIVVMPQQPSFSNNMINPSFPVSCLINPMTTTVDMNNININNNSLFGNAMVDTNNKNEDKEKEDLPPEPLRALSAYNVRCFFFVPFASVFFDLGRKWF
jgi:hypothetical protein